MIPELNLKGCSKADQKGRIFQPKKMALVNVLRPEISEIVKFNGLLWIDFSVC